MLDVITQNTAPHWMGATKPRAGLMLEYSVRFLAAQGMNAQRFPRKADGLVELSRIIERAAFDSTCTDAEDSAFIDGAGALLFLLLLDTWPDTSHVEKKGAHRLSLGRFGMVDPFSIIDRALDEPSPRRFFANALREIESEYHSNGRRSRVIRLFSERLSAIRPDLEWAGHFDSTVWLHPDIEVDLSRTIDATMDSSSQAATAAIDRLVQMLPGGNSRPEAILSFPEAKDRLLPRLIGSTFLTNADGASLFTVPWRNDISLAWVLSFNSKLRFVSKRDIDSWECSRDMLYNIALENLRQRSTQTRLVRHETPSSTLWTVRSGDGLDAARILLPELHEELTAHIGESYLVGIPHRDALWACNANNEPSVAALTARVKEDAQKAPHAISPHLYPAHDPST